VELFRALRRLNPQRRSLVVEAAMLLLFVRAGLRVCSYTRLHRALGLLASRATGATVASEPGHPDVAWAVTAAGRRLPFKTTCLIEALATDTMLRRRHHESRLCFGVRVNESRLDAHAWVECEGDLVIGIVDDLHEYAPLAN
jgi:transglutaminase superfamily protein